MSGTGSVDRLKTALADRYAIDREIGAEYVGMQVDFHATLHPRPGEASKLTPIVDRIWGQQPGKVELTQ